MGTLIAEPDYSNALASDAPRYTIAAEPLIYRGYVDAVMMGTDVGPTLQRISELPLEQRYVWRVASALAGALGDLNHRELPQIAVRSKTAAHPSDRTAAGYPSPVVHVPQRVCRR